MRTLIFLLLFTMFVFGQYSNDLVVNGTFTAWTGDNPDGWAVTEDANNIVTEGAGSTCQIVGDGSGLVKMNQNIITTGKTYKANFNISAASGNLACYIGASSTVYTTTGNKEKITAATTTGFYFRNLAAAQDHTIDNVICREQLTTIYINGGSGNDASKGELATPIATIDECDTRGYYAGGTVNIAAGTYAEDWDVAANITITATGTAFTIDQIDFGSNTVSCDYYVYHGATTVLNDENVTLTNVPSTDEQKGYKHRKGFSNFLEK